VCGVALLSIWGACQAPFDEQEVYSGGATTVFDETRDAFSRVVRNVTDGNTTLFFTGNSLFNLNWVAAVASTRGRDGLGPVFNAPSCSGCHFKDGRGAPPEDAKDTNPALLLRLSLPGKDEHGGSLPEPHYGHQLNPRSILGVPAEGRIEIRYTEMAGRFADGESYSLRKPEIIVHDLAFGALAAEVQFSARVAPGVYGLGLLQAIPEEAILRQVEEQRQKTSAIRGRPNWVWDVKAKKKALGRFGWKANQPSLEQQNAAAFLGDIGITTPLFPSENCMPIQEACRQAQRGGDPTEDDPELSQKKLDQVTAYTILLAPPARRRAHEPQVLEGKALFEKAGCTHCHTPRFVTGDLAGFPEVSRQVIYPYTDLLLHDMGEGLADQRPDFEAGGRDWRTPPLWGIGLVKVVNEHSFFLHDGRARGLMEAILWHDGEGKSAKEAVLQMTRKERDALLAFLESL
jgi:CxxC motif-containing protein (DUF1111 family)